MMVELRPYRRNNHHGSYVPPAGTVKPPKVHPKDRVCENEDCAEILGTYNPGPNCYKHTEKAFPRGSYGKRRVE